MNTGAAFYIIAGLTVASAIAAMALRNLVHGVLCLVGTFTGLALLYLQLGAPFIGWAQILVYVGAVAILIVFAILLTRSDEKATSLPIRSGTWWMGLAIALAVFAGLAGAIRSSSVANPDKPTAGRQAKATASAPTATVKDIGLKLLARSENYVLPLEVLGLLLTAALIGAAVIAMPDRKGGQ